MKRSDIRILIGIMLVAAGGLGLLETFGFLRDASDVFWGIVFLVAGGAFLTVFATGFSGGNWWAVIPGLVLAGIGVLILLPDSLDDLGGAIFLGALGLSFWLVYITGRDRWWALIPGGVLATLAMVSALSETPFDGSGIGGIFFLGLTLTFLSVGLLAGMKWAYWPAGALAVFGTFLFFESQVYLLSYLAAGALIVVGGMIIWRSLRS